MAAVIIPKNLPIGYRFHPTDEELVDHYLKLKVLGSRGNICIIPEVDICKWEPWELPKIFEEKSIVPPDDKVQEWWFFCPQTPRIQRSTPLGFWKKTGIDRTIKAGDRNREIGTKKTLVFHRGHGKRGIGTKWVIHEYHLLTNNLNELFPRALTKNYVVCHLKHQGNEESDFSAQQLNGGAISSMDLDSGLHQPEHNNSFPETWSEAVGNSSISLDDLDSNLHQPEHENLFPEPLIQAVENSSISLVDLQSDLRQPEHENSCPEQWILVGSGTESSLQQDNGVQVITSILPQTSFQSENVNSQTDLHVRNFGSLADDDLVVYIDESDELQVDFIDRDQIQTQYGPECSSDDKRAVLMKSQQAQMIESLHGIVSLDEKKGFIEQKFSGLHISSPKHMEPPKKPEIARTYSTDEESRVEKVEKLELGARNIKPECVTLDELEAKAKVGESREHRAASKSPQNNHNKGIEPAIEKPNSMPDLRRTITDCTKISMVPPLYGQTCSSLNAHAMVENWQTPTIETLHGQTSSLQNKNAMEDVRNYCKCEQPRLEKLRKEDLAARNIKSVNNPLDESIAIAKHDQASRLHKGSILEENWLTSTNKSLDGVLKGKKGCTESELDGWEIVSAKPTEHPKKAGNAGISLVKSTARSKVILSRTFKSVELVGLIQYANVLE